MVRKTGQLLDVSEGKLSWIAWLVPNSWHAFGNSFTMINESDHHQLFPLHLEYLYDFLGLELIMVLIPIIFLFKCTMLRALFDVPSRNDTL